jgi:hypothetical protein
MGPKSQNNFPENVSTGFEQNSVIHGEHLRKQTCIWSNGIYIRAPKRQT